MILGGWAHRLPPLPGELLTSCLARNAAAHGTSPYRFLALFWQGDPVWERDFDRAPDRLLRARRGAGAPGWLDDVAAALGVPRGAVEDATLAPLRAALGGPGLAARGDTPLVLSAGVHHRARTRHALQACPECLAEGVPHFRKIWRLGFVVACDQHRRRLSDGCARCGAPIVPHRSMTPRLTDCHACGGPVGGAPGTGEPPAVPDRVAALQRSLLGVLEVDRAGLPGPWRGREAFDAVRALLAVSAGGPVYERLHEALDVATAPAGRDGRLRFEQARLADRVAHLDLAAAWMADWPAAFRRGAEAAGITQRTFARNRLPPALTDEAARLPDGQRRDNRWKPVLEEEPVLKRLRRTDKSAYRELRARRIMAAIGRP